MKRKIAKLVEVPQEAGLKCPLCGHLTLSRDTAPAADGWYIEWCSGGVIEVVFEGEVYKFECPYVWAGFKVDDAVHEEG